MARKSRQKAGMPIDDHGIPMRCTTHQSESMNSILVNQRENVHKGNKNLTKLQFVRDVWSCVHSNQQRELELALCGGEQQDGTVRKRKIFEG